VIWGPFIFGGDTLLYGDTGRDDLPGGDPEAHYDSVQSVKAHARPEMIVLPGHDHKGGRASTWATQLKVNSSLTQEREDFVREAGSFEAPAPKLLKKSLFENFK
jgi:glyoxylase-like metal-dependent hydrolase (beta-lactamase superfamily II)